MGRATGSTEICEYLISNLSRISQLTGGYQLFYLIALQGLTRSHRFPDSIYADPYVKTHGFDIMLGKCFEQVRYLSSSNECLLMSCSLIKLPACFRIYASTS